MLIQIINALDQGYLVKADSPLQKGQTIVFSPSNIKGFVSSVGRNQEFFVKTNEQPSKLDKAAELYSWWTLKQPASALLRVSKKFFKESSTTAQLKVNLITQKETDMGSLGWDLFYKVDEKQDWLHILRGNDLEEQNVCQFKLENALWPKGIYLFKCTLFYRSNLVPLGESSFIWDLVQPTQNLTKTIYL